MEGGERDAPRDLRVLVFADLHLDRAFPWSTLESGAAVRGALETTFDAICAIAGAEADVLVSAGDLYDHDRHHPGTGELLRGAFERLAPMPVILVPGWSDPLNGAGLYEHVRWPANVHVVRAAETFEPEPGLRVWAAPAGVAAELPAANPGELGLAVVRDLPPDRLAELEARTDVSHVIAADTHLGRDGAKLTCPGAAHPVDPGDPPGGFVILTIAADGSVLADRRVLGGELPPIPPRQFATDELEGMALAVIGEEQTVRGEFVRNLLAPDEGTVHVRRLALLSGMHALAGRGPREAES